jgi:hypothetical protein
MPGVKGAGGPPPKRSDQRRRRNTPAAGEPVKVDDVSVVVVPEPDPSWHCTARIVWDSLSHSGQRQFYTSTDWSSAYVLCESISREMSPQPIVVGRGEYASVEMVDLPPKGASLSAWRALMAGLLMTEGDRRRAALELQRPKPVEPEQAGSVTSIASWKVGLSG